MTPNETCITRLRTLAGSGLLVGFLFFYVWFFRILERLTECVCFKMSLVVLFPTWCWARTLRPSEASVAEKCSDSKNKTLVNRWVFSYCNYMLHPQSVFQWNSHKLSHILCYTRKLIFCDFLTNSTVFCCFTRKVVFWNSHTNSTIFLLHQQNVLLWYTYTNWSI